MVVKPTLEEGEIFDSGSFREKIASLVSEGQRNIALDFSELSYLYSDAMNVLFNLNRQILDVSGRLALVSPTPEVTQILQGAGIFNFIKVYQTEADLQKSSEDIIMQTSGFSRAALEKQAGIAPAPKTEFEDFRSGIEEAIDVQRPSEAATPPSRPAPTPQQQYAPPAPTQFAPPPPPPPQYAPPPSAPPAPPPPPVAETPTFAPPPAEEAVLPPRPEKPVTFAEPPEKKERWTDEEEEEDVKTGKSPVLAIVVVVLIVAGLATAGAFFAPQIMALLTKKPDTSQGPQVVKPPQIPQLPTETSSAIAEDSTQEEEVDESLAEERKPQQQVRAPKPKPQRKPAATRRPQPRKTTPRRATPKPKPAAPQVNALTIKTEPSGATVTVDGKRVGTTPYTWKDPSVRGTVRIEARKSGYTTATKMVDFLGGEETVSLRLSPEPVKPSPKAPEPVVKKPTPAPPPPQKKPEPPKPKPAPVAQPKPAAPAPSASSGSPATVFVSSIPPVADVYMDGKLIGKTNIAKLNVSSGKHTMKFVKGAKEHTAEMTFQPGDNAAKHVTF